MVGFIDNDHVPMTSRCLLKSFGVVLKQSKTTNNQLLCIKRIWTRFDAGHLRYFVGIDRCQGLRVSLSF